MDVIWLADKLRDVRDGRAARAETLDSLLLERSRCRSCRGAISSKDKEDIKFLEARTVRRNGAVVRCDREVSWFVCACS